jgi:hypothetical protein
VSRNGARPDHGGNLPEGSFRNLLARRTEGERGRLRELPRDRSHLFMRWREKTQQKDCGAQKRSRRPCHCAPCAEEGDRRSLRHRPGRRHARTSRHKVLVIRQKPDRSPRRAAGRSSWGSLVLKMTGWPIPGFRAGVIRGCSRRIQDGNAVAGRGTRKRPVAGHEPGVPLLAAYPPSRIGCDSDRPSRG